MWADSGWGTWQGDLWLSLGAPIAGLTVGKSVLGALPCWAPNLSGVSPPLNLLAFPVTKHEALSVLLYSTQGSLFALPTLASPPSEQPFLSFFLMFIRLHQVSAVAHVISVAARSIFHCGIQASH